MRSKLVLLLFIWSTTTTDGFSPSIVSHLLQRKKSTCQLNVIDRKTAGDLKKQVGQQDRQEKEDNSMLVGETERLLLQRVQKLNSGKDDDIEKTSETTTTGITADDAANAKKASSEPFYIQPLRNLVLASFAVVSLIFPMLALFSMFGLVLNFFGYGYYFSQDDGKLVIDTLQHMRMEYLLENEAKRLSEEYMMNNNIQ